MRGEVRIRERMVERNINCREKGRDIEIKDEQDEEKNDLVPQTYGLGRRRSVGLSIGCVQLRTLDLGHRLRFK